MSTCFKVAPKRQATYMQIYLYLHNPVCPLPPPAAAPGVPSPVDTRNCSPGFAIGKRLVSSLKSNHAIAVCNIKSNAKMRSWSQPTVGHISTVSTATSPCSFSHCSALSEGKTLPPLFASAEGLYLKSFAASKGQPWTDPPSPFL